MMKQGNQRPAGKRRGSTSLRNGNTLVAAGPAPSSDAAAPGSAPAADGLVIHPPAQSAVSAAQVPPTQLVFIEGNVPDLQDLLNGLQPGAKAIVLDPSQDGVQQIATYLAQHNVHNLAAIDIVAHGSDGTVMLGSSALSSATIPLYQAQLAAIGNALAPNGAIQLYGCDVAQDAAGVSFINQLSQATGVASIAAASHLVGGAAGGGSFDLDVNIGSIVATAPFTAAAEAEFQGELATTITVSSEAQLNAAIAAIDGTSVAGGYTIDINANVTEAAPPPPPSFADRPPAPP
jgi:hypothetical protein